MQCTLLSPSNVAVKPASVWAFFDRVQIWLANPIDAGKIATLRANCGSLYVENRTARFNGRFRQRLDLKQPGDAALRIIAGLDGVLVNEIEIAVDWIFRDRNERDDAAEFLHWHLIRRWHPRKASIFVHAGPARTRYDARRGARNMLVVYAEAFSRITGECCSVHIEWRARGERAVRALGIESGQDLVDFDHKKFWEKRLLLVDIEPAHIGRYLRNRRTGSRNRAYEDNDDRDGQIVLDGVGSMQELLDNHGGRWRCGCLLHRLPTHTLLCSIPSRIAHTDPYNFQ